ncbi:hypothetical protein [Brachybacterium vulturis]|uniref:hypothetical protein n=1 Tax=Brachybacterium vulturis TaxID=2017484 RepID=UPI0037351CC2
MPVTPAAHYWMGGIRTALDGTASPPGLLRTGAELDEAADVLASWQTADPAELSTGAALEDRTLLDLARLLVARARARPDSLGAHHRLDTPTIPVQEDHAC